MLECNDDLSFDISSESSDEYCSSDNEADSNSLSGQNNRFSISEQNV